MRIGSPNRQRKPSAALVNGIFVVALAIAGTFVPFNVDAQDRFFIRGTLLEEGTDRPIDGAAIWLVDETGLDVYKQAQFTGDGGEFTFEVPPPGQYHFRIVRLGYDLEHTFAFDMPVGEHIDMVVYIVPTALELDQLTVTTERGDLRGGSLVSDFYWRVDHGLGRYLTREDMDQYPTLTFSDILGTVPGVVRTPTPQGEMISIARATPSLARLMNNATFRSRGPIQTGTAGTVDPGAAPRSRDAGGPGNGDPFADRNMCPVTIYLDGMQLNRHGDGSFGAVEMAYALRGENIEGVEIYRGATELPGEFMGNDSRCGVIAIWTRRWIASNGRGSI